jgi:hypothetical protein
MNDTELIDIVNAWITAEEAEFGSPEHESNWWAISQVIKWHLESKGELLWRFIIAAYKRELSDRTISVLAAGPLEDLLAKQTQNLLTGLKNLHERIPGSNYLLGGVWRNAMTDEIWQRVQAARHHVW